MFPHFMRLSIIVPAFNEEKLLGETLRSIRTACEPLVNRGWEVEQIVCDNNSTDATAELARSEGAKVVFEPVNQISRARNTGASIATGDWLLFIDADSQPSAELLADLADTISRGDCAGGGSVVKLDSNSVRLAAKCLVGGWNRLSRWQKWAAGSFVFCEAESFRELGGFSTELFASEEIEFSNRLKQLARRQGKRVVILHRHPLVTSSRKLRLYSAGEHVRFLLGTILRLGQPLRKRESCPIWYDGRR